MRIRDFCLHLLTGIMAVLLLSPVTGQAQEQEQMPTPLSNLVIAGYGTATYDAGMNDEFANDFTSSLAPVFLYSTGNDILFEAELEFGLSGESTTTTLEYAQIDYLGFERFQIIAGKFLLPFGLFSERLHPTWINKMPTAPLLYGHAHGGVAEGAMLPMLTDVGLLGRYKHPLGDKWAFDASAWVSQGPRLISADAAGDDHSDEEDDGHAHSPAPVGSAASGPGHDDSAGEGGVVAGEPPVVGFGVAFSDNNKNKMIGARLGLLQGGQFEIYVSGFHAMYDPDNALDIVGGDLAIEYRKRGFDLRGEGMVISQEFEQETGFDRMERFGYYVQAARRYGALEPVVRWSHLPETTVESTTVFIERQDLSIGLTYWLMPSVPVKVAYAVNPDGTDRLQLQWAYGF